MIKEACVTNLTRAFQAEQNGAEQIELCVNLELDGLTPPIELIQSVKESINIPIKVLVRPRGGDFVYNNEEIEVMKAQIVSCKKMQVAGVVTGALDNSNRLNISQIAELLQVADGLPIYIHKAIDATPNPLESLQVLRRELPQVVGVLTSGGAATARIGLPVLQQMLAYDQTDFEVVVAGKVTKENLSDLHADLKARYYHGRLIVG